MTRVRAATLALCLFGVLAAAVPALAAAGSISGTVTAAEGGGPVAGIEVCARIQPFTVEEACAETDAGGGYTISGLIAGSYVVKFSERRNRNYVDQYFDDSELGDADVLTIGASESRMGIDAVLRPGGTISGTVTDAGSGSPVAGLLVCAFAPTSLGVVGRCWNTDAAGDYEIDGLPPEDYVVEFLSEDRINYLPQYYDGVASDAAATPVTVAAANEVKAAIDAALLPGVEITGTLTEAGTHKPLSGVDVSLLDPVTEQALGRVAVTDGTGRYAFRGRPGGSYVIGFSHTPRGSFNSDCYSDRYYGGAASFAAALPLAVTAPSVLTGIDAELTDVCPEPGPQPVQVTFRPTDPPPPPLRCKKNQRKKWVKGRYRCVKKMRRHKKHHRRGKSGHGPKAVATGR